MNTLHISIELQSEHFENVIITALEGGSNYWYLIEAMPEGIKDTEELAKRVFSDPSFSLPILDLEDNSVLGQLTQVNMLRGFTIAAEEYPNTFCAEFNLDSYEGDADSADTIFQLAIMGELTFS